MRSSSPVLHAIHGEKYGIADGLSAAMELRNDGTDRRDSADYAVLMMKIDRQTCRVELR